MIAPTWLRTIMPDADADPSPKGGADERPQGEQLIVVAAEHERDAAPVQDRRAHPHR